MADGSKYRIFAKYEAFQIEKKINISLFKEPELLSMEYMCKLVEYEYIQFERGSEFVGN